jgi:CTP:molybdopterin cytidylyltransferase MocA
MKSKIYGIVISAGISKRMGENKALMVYENLPFVIQIILKLSFVCDRIVVVLGYEKDEVKNQIRKHLNKPIKYISSGSFNLIDYNIKKLKSKISCVVNNDFENGMFTSVKKGISKSAKADWSILHFVDQPGLPFSFYEDLVDNSDEKFDIVLPEYNSISGSPYLINSRIFHEIAKQDDKQNFYDFVKKSSFSVFNWNCPYNQVLQDVDTKTDYQNLIKSPNGGYWYR